MDGKEAWYLPVGHYLAEEQLSVPEVREHLGPVFADPENPKIIHHAQLVLGKAMVMLSSDVHNEARQRYRWRTPKEAGGVTMCVGAVIDDADAHYHRAKAEGAEIVTEVHDNEGYPGRSYNARDPEGNDWDFGTYNPWADPGTP